MRRHKAAKCTNGRVIFITQTRHIRFSDHSCCEFFDGRVITLMSEPQIVVMCLSMPIVISMPPRNPFKIRMGLAIPQPPKIRQPFSDMKVGIRVLVVFVAVGVPLGLGLQLGFGLG